MSALKILFLFAHQDDEFAVFQRISDAVMSGYRVYCAYLTNGAFRECPFEHRNQESLAVLLKLGVQQKDVLFVGQSLNIPDAELPEHMDLAAKWLEGWLSTVRIDQIYVPAWEGGHHDHDAVHAIGAIVGKKLGLTSETYQFPLYNAFGCKGPLFRVLLPLPLNGSNEKLRIPWSHRLRFLRYCLAYPSQAKTWFGLFPFVFFHYIVWGSESVQPISMQRLLEKPHQGVLYYESRGVYSWKKMRSDIEAILASWKIHV